MPLFHQPHNSSGNYSYNVYIYENIDWDLHFHKNYEIIHVFEGKVECNVDGRTKVLESGDFAFILSNEVHSLKSKGASRAWVGVFSEDFVQEFARYQKGKIGSDFVFGCKAELMPVLLNHLLRMDISDVFMVKACLYLLCSEYLRQIQLTESDRKHLWLMKSITGYIEQNYKQPISLASLAAGLNYEYCYFSRIFNRLFFMHFNDYLNIYRFNEACRLLSETELSVTEIAFESGFQSVREFHYVFNKLSDKAPSEYRKMYRSLRFDW